jgi:membrane-bound serine protease (ClpP class)
MRGIAEKQRRNADWAEKAVRESVSINEQEALDLNVIDLIAKTEKELLETIDGREIILEEETKILSTKEAQVDVVEMNWRHRILYKISNPTIAYILLMLGIYGIFFELSNPGAIIPGVVGGIFIILAFFALQTLPVRSAGILLILFSLVLFILEVKVTSFGILTIGGIVAMFLGSIMLFEETPGFSFQVDWRVAAVIALSTGLFFAFALGMALKARMQKPTTGQEGIVGEIGAALTVLNPNGDVKIHGEIWKAVANERVKKGEKIKAIEVDGMELKVKKIG